MEIPTGVKPQTQESSIPERNVIGMAEKALYATRNTTRASNNTERAGVERSLMNRSKRAELYKRAMSTSDREERKRIFQEAHTRDEIEAQYLSQGEVSVDMPNEGVQMARYVMLEPPETRKSAENSSKPPVFLIPGIANDLASVQFLAEELAYEGRSVVVVAQPDSAMGKVTSGFADAVDASPTLQPHAQFFENSMNALIGKDSEVELWGQSTGSLIIAELLNDPKMQKRVQNAVLLSPVGATDQSKAAIMIGTGIQEGVSLARKPSKIGKYAFVWGKNKNQQPDSKEDASAKKRVFNTVIERVTHKSPLYETMRVREGGNIVVVSGGKDRVTKSSRADNDFASHPQTELISLPQGIHNTPIVEAETVVPEIFAKQQIGPIETQLKTDA